LEDRAVVGTYGAIQEIEQAISEALATDFLDHGRKTGNPNAALTPFRLAKRQCCRHCGSSVLLIVPKYYFQNETIAM
jgi:hypothetical protein